MHLPAQEVHRRLSIRLKRRPRAVRSQYCERKPKSTSKGSGTLRLRGESGGGDVLDIEPARIMAETEVQQHELGLPNIIDSDGDAPCKNKLHAISPTITRFPQQPISHGVASAVASQ